MTKYLFYILLLLLIFFAGVGGGYWYHQQKNQAPIQEASLVLEQINRVAKLVTVEGQFIEYFDYGEPEVPLFIGPLLNYQALLPKKAAKLRIRAKVLVGFDLKQMLLETNEATKTISISTLPEAQVLAIDHQIDAFDNQSSVFRPLQSEDYEKISAAAREKIKIVAEASSLMEAARTQGKDLLNIIRIVTEHSGWKLELIENPLSPISNPDGRSQSR